MAETKDVQEQEQEEQSSSWLGDVVRVTILLWSMGILTANYLGIFSQAVDHVSCVALPTAATYTPALGKLNKKRKTRRALTTLRTLKPESMKKALALAASLLAAPAQATSRIKSNRQFHCRLMARDQLRSVNRLLWRYLGLTSLWALLLLLAPSLQGLPWLHSWRLQHTLLVMLSYSESYTEGDDVPTVLSTTVTSGVVPALPVFGNTTTTSGGVAGTLAGTIATDGALTITAGGAGTTAIGQVIQELTIK